MAINVISSRSLRQNQYVIVHVNLKNGLYSIKDAKTRLLIAYGDNFTLNNCKLSVYKGERKRVISSGLKNVHAIVYGYIDLNSNQPTLNSELTYCPFKYETFVDRVTKKPIYRAKEINFKIRRSSERNYHQVTYSL